jgi:hypothetical protein
MITLVTGCVLSLGAETMPQQAGRGDRLESTVYGYGMVSCGQWLKDTKDKPIVAAAGTQWLLGYVTALTRLGAAYGIPGKAGPIPPLARSDADAMTAWVDNYCAEHPLEQFEEAALWLSIELRKKAGGQGR